MTYILEIGPNLNAVLVIVAGGFMIWAMLGIFRGKQR